MTTTHPPRYDAIDGAATYDPAMHGVDEDDRPVTYWPRCFGPHIPQPDSGIDADLYPPS